METELGAGRLDAKELLRLAKALEYYGYRELLSRVGEIIADDDSCKQVEDIVTEEVLVNGSDLESSSEFSSEVRTEVYKLIRRASDCDVSAKTRAFALIEGLQLIEKARIRRSIKVELSRPIDEQTINFLEAYLTEEGKEIFESIMDVEVGELIELFKRNIDTFLEDWGVQTGEPDVSLLVRVIKFLEDAGIGEKEVGSKKEKIIERLPDVVLHQFSDIDIHSKNELERVLDLVGGMISEMTEGGLISQEDKSSLFDGLSDKLVALLVEFIRTNYILLPIRYNGTAIYDMSRIIIPWTSFIVKLEENNLMSEALGEDLFHGIVGFVQDSTRELLSKLQDADYSEGRALYRLEDPFINYIEYALELLATASSTERELITREQAQAAANQLLQLANEFVSAFLFDLDPETTKRVISYKEHGRIRYVNIILRIMKDSEFVSNDDWNLFEERLQSLLEEAILEYIFGDNKWRGEVSLTKLENTWKYVDSLVTGTKTFSTKTISAIRTLTAKITVFSIVNRIKGDFENPGDVSLDQLEKHSVVVKYFLESKINREVFYVMSTIQESLERIFKPVFEKALTKAEAGHHYTRILELVDTLSDRYGYSTGLFGSTFRKDIYEKVRETVKSSCAARLRKAIGSAMRAQYDDNTVAFTATVESISKLLLHVNKQYSVNKVEVKREEVISMVNDGMKLVEEVDIDSLRTIVFVIEKLIKQKLLEQYNLDSFTEPILGLLNKVQFDNGSSEAFSSSYKYFLKTLEKFVEVFGEMSYFVGTLKVWLNEKIEEAVSDFLSGLDTEKLTISAVKKFEGLVTEVRFLGRSFDVHKSLVRTIVNSPDLVHALWQNGLQEATLRRGTIGNYTSSVQALDAEIHSYVDNYNIPKDLLYESLGKVVAAKIEGAARYFKNRFRTRVIKLTLQKLEISKDDKSAFLRGVNSSL